MLEDSIYVVAAFSGWLVAQAAKFVLSLKQDGVTLSDLVQSGGMPSSHSSFMASITTVIGLVNGFDSAIFGLSLALTGVIAYDAFGVRRTAGENAAKIAQILDKLEIESINKHYYLTSGHKPVEVAVGLVTGLFCGLAVYAIYV